MSIARPLWTVTLVLAIWTMSSWYFYPDFARDLTVMDTVPGWADTVLKAGMVGRACGGVLTLFGLIAAIMAEANVSRPAPLEPTRL